MSWERDLKNKERRIREFLELELNESIKFYIKEIKKIYNEYKAHVSLNEFKQLYKKLKEKHESN